MGRDLRIEYDHAFYHVTSRGNTRSRIFKKNRDRIKFLDYLQHEDARRRAFALSALTALPKPLKDDVKARLLEDTARVTLYDFRTGELQQTTIADLARSGTSFGS